MGAIPLNRSYVSYFKIAHIIIIQCKQPSSMQYYGLSEEFDDAFWTKFLRKG